MFACRTDGRSLTADAMRNAAS